MTNLIIYLAASAIAGVGAGYAARIYVSKNANEKLEQKQKEILLTAKSEALKIREDAKKEEDRLRRDLSELEKSLRRREEMIDRRLESVEDENKKVIIKEKEIRERARRTYMVACISTQ